MKVPLLHICCGLLISLFMSETLLAQEASLKVQKNIVERIERIDQFLHDTIAADKIKMDRQSQKLLFNLRDSLLALRIDTQGWFVSQDSLIRLSNNQQNRISTQQQMIDALNWQVKDALNTKAELSMELGKTKAELASLKDKLEELANRNQLQQQNFDQLLKRWEFQQDLLNEIKKISSQNQRILEKQIKSDTTFTPLKDSNY